MVRYAPRSLNLTPAEIKENMAPAHLRLEAIAERERVQPVEQTERELASHDAMIGLAELLTRKNQEKEESNGYFSL
jgi:hypothetical protein